MIVLVLTSVTLISVAADGITLVDFKDEKMLSQGTRLTLIQCLIIGSLLLFLITQAWFQLKKPNRAQRGRRRARFKVKRWALRLLRPIASTKEHH